MCATYTNEETIFNFINPQSNDELLKISGSDLLDLIILINNYYISLRNRLEFEKSTTIGLELEYENANLNQIYEGINKIFPKGEWKIKGDESLQNGAEINSPILRDSKKCWEDLRKICSIIEPLANIDKNSGAHIHIGSQILGKNKDSWLNFIKLWSVYENIIFRFVYGEFLTARPNIRSYAQPVASDFWNCYENAKVEKATLDSIISTLSETRNQAVNFSNVSRYDISKYNEGNTIEFRCPNGTLDPIIWQNNVNLFVRMLYHSKSKNFRDDIVEKRHIINSNKFTKLKCYNEIYLEQALEFCDMIFSNNLDKVYFLRQYLKSFETCNKKNKYPKARTFTKKI